MTNQFRTYLTVDAFLRATDNNDLDSLPDDLFPQFREWQTTGLMELGAALRSEGWHSQLRLPSSDGDEARRVAIAILAAATDGDQSEVLGILKQLPRSRHGTLTEQVYSWLSRRLLDAMLGDMPVQESADEPKTPAVMGSQGAGQSSRIPPENRTRPMNLQEAGRFLGYEGQPETKGKAVRRAIDKGQLTAEELNRASWIFDKTQFPKDCWPKILPKSN